MTTRLSEVSALVVRVENLERQNRRLKAGLTMVLLAASVIVLLGQAAPSDKTIEAQQIILRDENGKIRVGLYSNSSGVILYDGDGRTQAMLTARGSSPALQLVGPNERTLTLLTPSSLSLNDGYGRPRVRLDGGGNVPGLVLLDENNHGRLMLDAAGTVARLTPVGADGEIRREKGVTGDEPGLALFDASGKTRMAVSVLGPGPELGLYDSNGKAIFSALH